MNTLGVNAVTVGMLLWEADVHDKKGEKKEAAKIREWVAQLLCEQSKLLRSVWGQRGGKLLRVCLSLSPRGRPGTASRRD